MALAASPDLFASGSRSLRALSFILALIVGSATGLALTWHMSARDNGFGAVDVGVWREWPRSGTLDAAPYARASVARSGALRSGGRDGLRRARYGGELRGPAHIRSCLDSLSPTRLGHGVRAAALPRLLDELVARGVALEVCPVSNVALDALWDKEDIGDRVPLPIGVTPATYSLAEPTRP